LRRRDEREDHLTRVILRDRDAKYVVYVLVRFIDY